MPPIARFIKRSTGAKIVSSSTATRILQAARNMNKGSSSENVRRILGRIAPPDFVGRTGELDRIMAHAEPANSGRGLLLLMEPSAGVSEVLRQAYDQIFNKRTDVIPIYFAFTRNETTAVSAARSEEHTSELQSPCNLVCRL